MREGWTEQKLVDICKLRNGRAYKKSELLDSGKYPVLRVGNFFTNRNWYYSDLELDDTKYCKNGDLLYAWSASFGPRIWDGEKSIYHYHIWRVDRNESLVSKRFLFYWFDWDAERIKDDHGAGTTMIHVSMKSMNARPVLLPPLPEQERIVSILDEAFAAIAIATANAEKNLANARELFASTLRVCFDQSQELPSLRNFDQSIARAERRNPIGSKTSTSTNTKGRAATDKIIEGEYSLSVGMPTSKPRMDWTWSPLSQLARLESGHTPSRRHPEYWNGDIPWIGIKDAKRNHGKIIEKTETCTNQLGLDNSAARLLPENTVCLSRTASVGYVTVLGAPMATSQDFVNWVCSPELLPDYLKYLLLSQNRDFALFSSGAVHQTIYFPEVKAFHICHPDYTTQCKMVDYLDKLNPKTESLIDIYTNKLNRLSELKQSILHKAFSGELTADPASIDRALSEASV